MHLGKEIRIIPGVGVMVVEIVVPPAVTTIGIGV
jgi:hypothetical protein